MLYGNVTAIEYVCNIRVRIRVNQNAQPCMYCYININSFVHVIEYVCYNIHITILMYNHVD